jgi:hypothetical protein
MGGKRPLGGPGKLGSYFGPWQQLQDTLNDLPCLDCRWRVAALAIRQFEDSDLVIFDPAGRSFVDESYCDFAEIVRSLAFAPDWARSIILYPFKPGRTHAQH